MPQFNSAERVESRRHRLETSVHQDDHEHSHDNSRGSGQFKGIEYGVNGTRYSEYSVDPTPIDIASTPECFLAAGIGRVALGEQPTAGMVFFGPATAWTMAANYPQYPQFQQPIVGLEIASGEGTFEILDDDELVYASNLEITATDGTKYQVTSVLNMMGDLKDRDKDGYADSFRLDEVIGHVVVTATAGLEESEESEEILNGEYSFELRKKPDILTQYGYGSSYSASAKGGVGMAPAVRGTTNVHNVAFRVPQTSSAGIAMPVDLGPFIQANSAELSNAYNSWARCYITGLRTDSFFPKVDIALGCAL